jgi:hypothetical protein
MYFLVICTFLILSISLSWDADPQAGRAEQSNSFTTSPALCLMSSPSRIHDYILTQCHQLSPYFVSEACVHLSESPTAQRTTFRGPRSLQQMGVCCKLLCKTQPCQRDCQDSPYPHPILWNRKFRHRFHKIPTPDRILSMTIYPHTVYKVLCWQVLEDSYVNHLGSMQVSSSACLARNKQ